MQNISAAIKMHKTHKDAGFFAQLESLLLGIADEVEVLEPKELREKIFGRAFRTLEKYYIVQKDELQTKHLAKM